MPALVPARLALVQRPALDAWRFGFQSAPMFHRHSHCPQTRLDFPCAEQNRATTSELDSQSEQLRYRLEL